MPITKLYVHESVADSPEGDAIGSRLGLSPQVITDDRSLFGTISEAEDPIAYAKEILYLTKNRGAFIRKCPGTRTYTCCGYQILHTGTFCTMDCAYCILQAYFHPPVLSHYVNYGDMRKELGDLFALKTVARIGTGEFTDSLIWERWTTLIPSLISDFSDQSSAVLELKTKTTAIDSLKGLDHNEKTIVAWSLNTERIIRDEEKGTATLSARLRAAAACAAAGYPIAFHFDPIFIYGGCEAEYRSVIQQIFAHVSPDNVVWISLGTFRFMPALKTIVQERFPPSGIVYGEFIPGLDGKMRYFKPLRIEAYRKMASWIRKAARDVLVYLCMEDDEVWEKSLGFTPDQRGGLPRMLDERAKARCDLSGAISTPSSPLR